MTSIGFVGLGAMGSALAGRLLDAGHTVYGTNRTKDRADPLLERGLIWHDTPREVAQEAEVVFSMVTDSRALEAITGAQDGILAGLRPGAVYVDMSTVSPQTSAEIAERVKALGAAMLDAPVSGSVPAAQEGSLAIMVGGDPDALAGVEPLLRHLGKTITHVGGNGKGLMMKLALNISLAVQMIAFSEGVVLAAKGGVATAQAIEVLTSSPLGSPMGNFLPYTWRITPGSAISAAGISTQPIARSGPSTCHWRPPGSTLSSVVPDNAPPCSWKYQYGKPFTAVTTAVSGPSSGGIRSTIPGTECALSAITT